MKKPIHIVLFIVAAISILLILSLPVKSRFQLKSTSISGEVVVRGLPFKGSKSGPLDGTLRLYINGAKYQTNLPFDYDLDIEWNEVDKGESFAISKGHSHIVLMKWAVDGDALSCVEGKDYLVADPD